MDTEIGLLIGPRELIQQRLLLRLAEPSRQIHHVAARVLESRDAGLLYDVEIARHWEAAGEAPRAAQAYARAAQRSLAAHAHEEAANFAARGLPLTGDAALRW